MSEHKFGLLKATQKTALEQIEHQTLREVDKKYTTGYPDYRGCGEGLLYHNGYHARSVGRGALRMAQILELAPDIARVGEIAGYAHDFYQGRGHEQRSADWLEKQLRDEKLPAPMAQMASLAIKGTEPIFADGIIVGQAATRQHYPSREAEQIALSVASADLSVLCRPVGPLMAHDLYRELRQETNPAIDEKLSAFQQKQMLMLDSYAYPLPQAERMFATHRPQVTAYHEKVLEQLDRGEIEDWAQLRAQDEAFLVKHSS